MSKTELKTFNPEANSFEANGKKYLIHGSLSTFRYPLYEKFQASLAWGVEFQEQYNNLQKAYDFLNKSKPADAAVFINNVMAGVARKIEGRAHPALMICTLFICREGEDLTTWNEAEAIEKISDWDEEGYDINSFFLFAQHLVRGLPNVLEMLSANTSIAK